jgi:hypothetical protein
MKPLVGIISCIGTGIFFGAIDTGVLFPLIFDSMSFPMDWLLVFVISGVELATLYGEVSAFKLK